MNELVIILIAVAIIGSIGIYYATLYNKLQHFKNRMDASENTIDDSLREKYDLLCDLNNEVKSVIKDKDYLKEFIEIKNTRITNYDTDRKLSEAFIIIDKLLLDNKKLNTKEFNKKVDKVKAIDETLVASKSFYNKYTSELNSVVRKFPSNFIAKIHGFKIKPYFDNKNMQDAVIDDFKL